MAYQSPIELYAKPMIRQYLDSVDGFVVESVMKLGINVNKEELEKALKYDRQQYAKGYTDGYEDGRTDATEQIVRCKDCKYRYKDGDNVVVNYCLLAHNKVQSDDWFCADAELRREDDE